MPRPILTAIAAAMLGAVAASAAFAQQGASPQPPTIGCGARSRSSTVAPYWRSGNGEELTLRRADRALVAAVVKASIADIKPGLYIGSGAMPQPDGSQKALEVHIFAESMRGTGEGHRPWDGAPNSTMTNGTVGARL